MVPAAVCVTVTCLPGVVRIAPAFLLCSPVVSPVVVADAPALVGSTSFPLMARWNWSPVFQRWSTLVRPVTVSA